MRLSKRPAVGLLLGGAALLLVVVALRVLGGVTLVVHFKEDVPVGVRGTVPVRAALDQDVQVTVPSELAARVKVGKLRVPVDETVVAPLDFTMNVPIDTQVMVDQELALALEVPIDTVLTERELDLSQLEIPIDTDIFIDDAIDLDLVVPVDSSATTALGVTVPVKMQVPVKAKVPVRQKVRVRDTVKLGVRRLRVPVHFTLPVHTRVPLKQPVAVRGEIAVPVKRDLAIPIHHVLTPSLDEEIPLMVQLTGGIPAHVRASLDTNITVDGPIQTHLGAVRVTPGDVHVER